jgi:hypothetical protein
MESPKIWNALIASLAFCDLRNPQFAWAFMVVQGYVRDELDDRDSFLRIVREQDARDHTGPSLAFRVAAALDRAGIARSSGMAPDPWGAVTGSRVEIVASWGALDSGPLEATREWESLWKKG